MISPDAGMLGARLDQHHLPETNGRMAICRRCGAQTNGPDGRQHLPDGRRIVRASEWLSRQERLDKQKTLLERAKDRFAK